jgi:transmembrane sensor
MAEEPLFELPGRIQPQWTARREAQVRAAIERGVRRRRAARWAVATSSLILVGGLIFALFVRQKSPTELADQKPASVQSSVPRATPAEPTATPLTADTELVVDPQGAGRAFVLRRGSARFVVIRDERRPFRVRVGPLVVEDLGTVFSVSRLSEYEFDVAVEEGNVAVLCGNSRVELGGGQRRTFACGEPEKQATGAATSAAVPVSAGRPHPPREEPTLPGVPSRLAAPAWRVLAERGQYREAYDSLRGESEASVRDETRELLLAADTARLSGHASEAVPYLRRVLVRRGDDPRAHLAAFTLGRVLLDELGRPAEAAEAFARARASQTPLAEDALAREVEAWARAGDARRSHDLALEYQRSYPQGRRMRAVTKFGGLE